MNHQHVFPARAAPDPRHELIVGCRGRGRRGGRGKRGKRGFAWISRQEQKAGWRTAEDEEADEEAGEGWGPMQPEVVSTLSIPQSLQVLCILYCY